MALATIVHEERSGIEWDPYNWHCVHNETEDGVDGFRWRVDSQGIWTREEPDKSPYRTRGQPLTLQRVLNRFGDHIRIATTRVAPEALLRSFRDPQFELPALISAILATENGGRLVGDRYEPHISDWSFGPAQFLTSTALNVARSISIKGCPSANMKTDSSPANKLRWRHFLENPLTATLLCVAFLHQLNESFDCRGDPILLYASYNAGSPRPSRHTRFGLVYYDPDLSGPKPGSVDRFAAWYGDACKVLHDLRAVYLS